MASTRILTLTRTIDAERPDEDLIAKAAHILLEGGLVAFATETVYGLGADATNAKAVTHVFHAKGRPANNPLIVHVSGKAMAESCVADWPECAELLAKEFWPGPLTLVLPRSSMIPDVVTGGADTVAVRAPQCAVARMLIERAGRPIAAPSANRSSGVSPTLASHVLQDLDGNIDLILDSGRTTLGLESTVVDLTTRHPRVLRPGPIGIDELRRVLPNMHVHEAITLSEDPHPRSPGQSATHYAPMTKAVRVDAVEALEDFEWPEQGALLVIGEHDLPEVPESIQVYELVTPEVAARDLYLVLRQCDEEDYGLIIVLPPPDRPEWHAIRDRLWRATKHACATPEEE
jgi:L-threonylcarbamoyladenylate synthase